MPEQPKLNQQPLQPDNLHNLSVLTPEDKQTPEYQRMRERIDSVKEEMKKVSEDESLAKAERMKIITGELMAKLEKAQRFNDKFSGSSELFEKLDLETQYSQRYETLKKINLLETLSTGQEGIIGLNHKEYPIPTRDEIKARIAEKEAMLEAKIEQGFTKLILVPFGTKLSNLTKSYSDTIKKHYQQGTLKATDGTSLQLDESEPLWVWDGYNDADANGNLIYYPKEFSQDNHQGQTKQELLDSETPSGGWQLLLIEDLPNLPAKGKGQTIGGRQQLTANQAPKEYLNKLKTESSYQDEQGLTPEAWLTIAAAYLEENNQVIDDWQGQGKACWNLGAYFPSSGSVSLGDWWRRDRQADLYRDDAGYRSSSRGARSSVMV